MFGRTEIAGDDRRGSLLERDRELAAVDRLLADAKSGTGRVVLIEGEPGIGKSELLDAIASSGADGCTILRARGGKLEAELPWEVVRDLFEPELVRSSPERLAELSAGAAALAGPAVGPSLGAPALPPDAEPAASALHGLYWLCSHLAERDPLVLLVDDLHWCDLPSLRFLAHLAEPPTHVVNA